MLIERTKNIDVALVYKLWNEFASALNKGDLEGWINLWNEDGIQMPAGASRQVGKEQILAAVQSTFELFIIRNMVIDTEAVRVLGEWAYAHGRYSFDMTPKVGGKTVNYRGMYLDILVKQADGSWKIAVDCHNCSTPTE